MSEAKEISFVVKYYKKGSFSVDNAWASLGLTASSKWRQFRVAAAIAVIVALSATAAVFYNQYQHSADQPASAAEEVAPALSEVVRVIDFEEVPLQTVVEKIKEVYDVEIVNLPDNTDDYMLSLHYEGTAEDLVVTINELLDIKLKIR